MNLILQTEYWDDHNARVAFKKFIKNIHNLDFTDWEAAGYWDTAYTPFSLFREGEVVSSMCVYLLNAVIHGKETRIAQISGVGTDPLFRRQGLNRELTTTALTWAQDKTDNGFFLFADKVAIPFYEACGFSSLVEHVEHTEPRKVTPINGLIRLNPDNPGDLQKIDSYADKRIPVSNTFSVMNKKLLMFHVLYSKREHLYEIPDLECVVSFKRQNGCLSIYDIIGANIPTFQELYPYITDTFEKTIEFHFHTDKLNVDNMIIKPRVDSCSFVKGPFPFEKPVFPSTSQA